MIDPRQKTFYHNLKDQLKHKYQLVNGSRSQIIDLVGYGIEADYFYKIVTLDQCYKVDSMIDYLKKKFKMTLTNKYYIVIYLDEEFKENFRKEYKIR